MIDLHPYRLGRCYETFWDRYAIPGGMPLVPDTITGLLRWLLESVGQGSDAQLERHPATVDAYDDTP